MVNTDMAWDLSFGFLSTGTLESRRKEKSRAAEGAISNTLPRAEHTVCCRRHGDEEQRWKEAGKRGTSRRTSVQYQLRPSSSHSMTSPREPPALHRKQWLETPPRKPPPFLPPPTSHSLPPCVHIEHGDVRKPSTRRQMQVRVATHGSGKRLTPNPRTSTRGWLLPLGRCVEVIGGGICCSSDVKQIRKKDSVIVLVAEDAQHDSREASAALHPYQPEMLAFLLAKTQNPIFWISKKLLYHFQKYGNRILLL